jgi:hypothetical protein
VDRKLPTMQWLLARAGNHGFYLARTFPQQRHTDLGDRVPNRMHHGDVQVQLPHMSTGSCFTWNWHYRSTKRIAVSWSLWAKWTVCQFSGNDYRAVGSGKKGVEIWNLERQRSLQVLTPCSWVLEKPPAAKLLRNLATLCGTRRFITVFTRALHWSLSWARWIQSIPLQPI